MNTELVNVIKQYLAIETNYAVILNGDYGIGKTHFYKNYLSKEIEKVSTPKNAQNKYKPVHISLFGLKSLEEVQTSIFLELYPILKDKKLKLATGIVKTLIRGIASINRIRDLDKYIDDIKPNVLELLSYNELVICFDDIDRKSNSLELNDLYGFINTLVENEGAKILLIANESVLENDDKYKKIREKVVGIIIQYKPDIQLVYEQIIKQRYSETSKPFYEYLYNNTSHIVKIIRLNQNNFRNLIFFLEHYRYIYNSLEAKFQEDDNFSKLKEERHQAVLCFTLAITMEYKAMRLNSTHESILIGLGNRAFFSLAIMKKAAEVTNSENSDINYITELIKKYFAEKNYYYFKSIFDYITGSKSFDIRKLKEELSIEIIDENNLPLQDKLLNELYSINYINLNTSEYRKKINKMLRFAYGGMYKLEQYISVFTIITRDLDIIGLDLKNIKNKLIIGVDRGKKNYTYDGKLEIMNYSYSSPELNEIFTYCIKINNEIKEKQMSDSIKHIFNEFKNNYDSFTVIINNHNNGYTSIPFWHKFNVKETAKVINKLENLKIWELGEYFSSRYKITNVQVLSLECDFMISLVNELNRNSAKRSKKNLKNRSLNHLVHLLNQSIAIFK